jgi:2-haloacid dehalogenase
MASSTVLLDLDHTLLDSDASELAAFDATLFGVGVAEPRQFIDTYLGINRVLWAGVERGEITPAEVAVTRFVQLTKKIGLDADPEVMADAFLSGLGEHGDLYPDARSVLENLAANADLAMVTNGVGRVQRARIERLGLASYFSAVVISGEVGTSKPGPAIFDLTFEQLGSPALESAIMVGDSLSSDIRGGREYGIETCWYNPHQRNRGADDHSTHEIHRLAQLPDIIFGGW